MRLTYALFIAALALAATAGVLTVLLSRRAAPGAQQPAPAGPPCAAAQPERNARELRILYPEDRTLFPPELPPPTFIWVGPAGAARWSVTVEPGLARAEMVAGRDPEAWTPGADDWNAIKRAAPDKPVRFRVSAMDSTGALVSEAAVSFSLSRDPVGAPIFFREVNLPFAEAVKDPSRIRWRCGGVGSPGPPPVVLEQVPVCANCHSFSRDGRTLGMDVDYANDKGSYAIAPVAREMALAKGDVITWSDYRREDNVPTFGLLSQVSPDGRYVASTVKDRSVFVATPDLAFSQLFFPVKGIVGVYDRRTRRFSALPGADDADWVQSNPTWSPDGRHIVFAKAKAYELKHVRSADAVLLTEAECREFLRDGRMLQFDLYRIPFNEGRGGRAEPLAGASGNGMSNYFPRFSPDGRWIVFCKSRSFMLLQPDSELWIVPAQGGQARRLRCNTPRMNSWHSWSPDGKWLVFSSKANGPYTQLFLTHIDEEGNSSPAVLLDRLTAPDRAANIPEFVNAGPAGIARIQEQFLDALSYVRAGHSLRLAGDMAAAARRYRKALSLDARCAEAHIYLGLTLHQQDALDQSAAHLLEGIRLAPENAEAHLQLGLVRAQEGKTEEAERLLRAAIAFSPDLARAHGALGLLLEQQGRQEQALDEYSQAVRLDPTDALARMTLGLLLCRLARIEQAVVHLREAVELQPADGILKCVLGEALTQLGRHDEALRLLTDAARLAPHSAEARQALGAALLRRGDLDEAVEQLLEAARLEPGRPGLAPSLRAAAGMAQAAGRPELARRITAAIRASSAAPHK